MDKKVELQVLNITNSQAQVGAFAMLLGEVDGERSRRSPGYRVVSERN